MRFVIKGHDLVDGQDPVEPNSIRNSPATTSLLNAPVQSVHSDAIQHDVRAYVSHLPNCSQQRLLVFHLVQSCNMHEAPGLAARTFDRSPEYARITSRGTPLDVGANPGRGAP